MTTEAQVPRPEADPSATAPALTNATDIDLEASRKRNEIVKASEAELQKTVEEASAKHQAVLAENPAPGSYAEIAWNDTKAEGDPLYAECTGDHRRKLDTAVDAITRTGRADIVGLEAFEARVKELIEAQKSGKPVSKALATTGPKRGKLPDDFPHVETLRAADINTYAQARAYNGDYTEVEGIGEARGKEIDAAL